MRRTSEEWTVEQLRDCFARIHFPEYQREPNVWNKSAKQRLIDSMTREFDIASIYLYRHIDGTIDCIDGRQRIGAIMSFLGGNEVDPDNHFEYRILNEIYTDEDQPFKDLNGATFADIRGRASEPGDLVAGRFVNLLHGYKLTVVALSDSEAEQEFNLQFTRLNLGTIINSGEKLHAMVGDLRNECFSEAGLGSHVLLANAAIPTRRFAKEQVAVQIVGQEFAFRETQGYTRMRYFDMQRLLKRHVELTEAHRGWIADIRLVMDLLAPQCEQQGVVFRGRAMIVSTVLLAMRSGVASQEDAGRVAAFIAVFLRRLQWQVRKGYNLNREYQYLLDFQRHLTQASVERPAVEARAATLLEEFERFNTSGQIRGDEEHIAAGGNPVEESQKPEINT